jgi:hypothetical protein
MLSELLSARKVRLENECRFLAALSSAGWVQACVQEVTTLMMEEEGRGKNKLLVDSNLFFTQLPECMKETEYSQMWPIAMKMLIDRLDELVRGTPIKLRLLWSAKGPLNQLFFFEWEEL